jgi:hypothetical protein
MLRATALLMASCAALSHSAGAAQPETAAPIGCVSSDKLACGCHMKVKHLACTPAGSTPVVHFFTGLDLSDPLHLVLDGQATELPHTAHRGNSVKGDSRGRWVDEYSNGSLRVRVSYAPGKSTCPKSKGEPCEFTDYNAVVTVVTAASTPRVYKTTARCGC